MSNKKTFGKLFFWLVIYFYIMYFQYVALKSYIRILMDSIQIPNEYLFSVASSILLCIVCTYNMTKYFGEYWKSQKKRKRRKDDY